MTAVQTKAPSASKRTHQTGTRHQAPRLNSRTAGDYSPTAAAWEWQLHGACRGMDSAQFFHPEGERGSQRLRRELKAKALCAQCPVLADCRQHALATQETYGIWGGLSETERVQILRSGKVQEVLTPQAVAKARQELRQIAANFAVLLQPAELAQSELSLGY